MDTFRLGFSHWPVRPSKEGRFPVSGVWGADEPLVEQRAVRALHTQRRGHRPGLGGLWGAPQLPAQVEPSSPPLNPTVLQVRQAVTAGRPATPQRQQENPRAPHVPNLVTSSRRPESLQFAGASADALIL